MTVYEAVFSCWRQPLLAVLFLLLTGHMALIFAALRDGWSRRFRAFLLAHFSVSAALFWFCLSEICWDLKNRGDLSAQPGWLSAIGGMPVSALVLYELAAAGILAFAARDTVRYRAGHVTPDSVKQTMDLLPVGVACGLADGTVLFRNLVMDRLSMARTGRMLTDLNAFRAAFGEGQVTAGEDVWQISACETPDSPVIQFTATQITEQARLLDDLKAKNKKLRDIHLRLDIYNRQAERIIIAQELLTARMTVHDELGSVLLESRHYMNDPSSIDENLLLQALKNTNTYLLREYEKDDTAVDPLREAFETAEVIGVKVTLTGVPPAEEGPRAVLAAAVRECAANTVKHAEGDRLRADVRRTDNGYTFVLTGSGRLPEGPVRETGGLLSLRTLTESHGGSMRIDCVPEVRITVTVPLLHSS